MNVTYDYYRIFYFVAKCGSFTKAAEAMGNSQPNITRSMNNLEAQTGLKLFTRNRHGVILTPEGKRLYEHVKVAFFHLARAEEEMQQERVLSGGTIIIGVSEIALHEVLLPKLRDFHRRYPGIRIELTNQSTPEIIEALRKGLVNFALVTTPFRIHSPLSARKIRDFEEVLVAGSDFSELKGRKVSLKEIEDYPWISLQLHTATRTYYERFFAENALRFEPQFLAATADQVLPMIRAGLGIGFVPVSMLYEEADVFKVQTDILAQPRSVHLITDTEHPLSAAAWKLIEMIEDCELADGVSTANSPQ